MNQKAIFNMVIGLLDTGCWPFLIQDFDPFWYLIMLGVKAWCTYWAILVTWPRLNSSRSFLYTRVFKLEFDTLTNEEANFNMILDSLDYWVPSLLDRWFCSSRYAWCDDMIYIIGETCYLTFCKKVLRTFMKLKVIKYLIRYFWYSSLLDFGRAYGVSACMLIDYYDYYCRICIMSY